MSNDRSISRIGPYRSITFSPLRGFTYRPFAATASRAALATLAAVRPYFSINASGAPLSPNWSPRFTKRIGTGWIAASVMATTLPSPP